MATPILQHLERYFDAAPRVSGTVEDFGSITLFIPEPAAMPFYLRPTYGHPGPVDADDVRSALARQRELGLPRAAEWVAETTPSMRAVAAAAGMTLHEHPLMVLAGPAAPRASDLELRVLAADDPLLVRAVAVQHIGFDHPGIERGASDETALADIVAELDGSARIARISRRISQGRTVVVSAYEGDQLIATGGHNPVGDTTEIIGVATLPAARRRGAAQAVAGCLVSDAASRGVGTVFLSADSVSVARIYQRVGFERVATAMTAEGD